MRCDTTQLMAFSLLSIYVLSPFLVSLVTNATLKVRVVALSMFLRPCIDTHMSLLLCTSLLELDRATSALLNQLFKYVDRVLPRTELSMSSHQEGLRSF